MSTALHDAPDVDDLVDAAKGRLRTSFAAHPTLWLVASLAALQAVAFVKQFGKLGPRERLWLFDSVIFEYIGWAITRGDRLYVDVWEVKPPLPFEVTAFVGLFFDDVYHYHLALLALTALMAIGVGVLVGRLVADATGNEAAGYVAGVTLFFFPRFAWRVPQGFKAKYLVLFAVLGAVYSLRRERYALAGVAAAAAAATWQVAVITPVVVGGLVLQSGDRAALKRFAAGVVGTTVVVLAPVVLVWHSLGATIAEAVFAPFLFGEETTAPRRIQLAARLLARTIPVFLLGAIGVARGVGRDLDRRWWVGALGVWFGVQVVFLDLDRHPDLFPLYVVVALGVGYMLGDREGVTESLGPILVALTVVAALTAGGLGMGATPPRHGKMTYTMGNVSTPVDTGSRLNGSQKQAVFWNTGELESCHAFAGLTQWKIVHATNGSMHAETCGNLTAYWRAFEDRRLGG